MSDSQRGLFDKLNEENDRYAKARRILPTATQTDRSG
ncbi:Uncharacterised protein [Pseudomonas aeruginosa]|nr:Uncharacterised protein [Pseudomonas aeruginosa]